MSNKNKACPHCGQERPDAWFEVRNKLRGERIRQALAEAKKNGERVGRRRKINYDEARNLRSQGLTLRQIGKELKCTASTVLSALRETDQ